MKKIVMAMLLMAGVAGMAQENTVKPAKLAPHKMEKVSPEEQVKQLTTELNLDAKQQAQIKDLYAQQEKTRAELKEQRKTAADDQAKADLKAKAKEENKAFADKMKEILTPEQHAKWKADLKEKRAAGKPKIEKAQTIQTN